MHLAQLNIAMPKFDLDDPRIADFVNAIDRVNALGERMDGFVWRWVDGEMTTGNAANPWPGAIINMTVWESPEQLEHFVWNTVHKHVYRRKDEWFANMESHHFVMWWVEEGHVPSLAEAKERLDHLDMHGSSNFAFGWSHLPHVKLWQTQRCA
ncbi:MAG: DUF3291 domain-containing protein [Nitratireductor sp.]|nr:DUF3291 domain-containing protein [Nitratireductor sp.]MCC0019630.1 DUF3291 domain-containing protein [Nitratireductor sp.]